MGHNTQGKVFALWRTAWDTCPALVTVSWYLQCLVGLHKSPLNEEQQLIRQRVLFGFPWTINREIKEINWVNVQQARVPVESGHQDPVLSHLSMLLLVGVWLEEKGSDMESVANPDSGESLLVNLHENRKVNRARFLFVRQVGAPRWKECFGYCRLTPPHLKALIGLFINFEPVVSTLKTRCFLPGQPGL